MGYPDSWSSDKREFCCIHRGIGCTDPFNCQVGLVNWREGWSDAKKAWCCKHHSRGCIARETHPAVSTAGFDCKDKKHRTWPQAQKMFCCLTVGVGCPTPYNCVASASMVSTWSTAQRKWCCEQKAVACLVGSVQQKVEQLPMPQWNAGHPIQMP